MKRVQEGNINTPRYWDFLYERELAQGRQRVDSTRMAQLARWLVIRKEELGRPPAILDAGCGSGEVAEKLSTMGNHYGIDISSVAVDFCRRKFGGDDTWKTADIEKIPFPDGRFDVVWCGETLEHCNDPDQAIAELARVSGDLGFVILTTPYRGRNRDPEHIWEFDPADIVRWAFLHGELVYFDCVLLPSWLSMFAVIRHDPSRRAS